MKPDSQLELLKKKEPHHFDRSINRSISQSLTGLSLKTFQINIGRWCNQACKHCHVDASPVRTEEMDKKTAQRCVDLIASLPEVETVDITGGSPEGSASFKFLVKASGELGKHVIDRCNLTILEEPGFEWLAGFLKENEVEIICSLPHYSELRTDQQRGKGVYEKSIRALKKLNRLGYGSEFPLNLVYNPTGFFLSSDQTQLEKEFKEHLYKTHGIVFDSLYCINNVPINRFLEALIRKNKYQDYLETLVHAYNPSTLEGLMCRHQISIDYQGYVYDCDFNQMLELKAKPVSHIDHFDYAKWKDRKIQTANHCYACTAGAGSSCGGKIISKSLSKSLDF